ncbi:hypothetical protein BJV78DRAFT_1209436 [Lactifluus subvellereus]|nr:hypothetical protein BJV78DRAFT_1209436 [Lactifluus subvellereus]
MYPSPSPNQTWTRCLMSAPSLRPLSVGHGRKDGDGGWAWAWVTLTERSGGRLSQSRFASR